MDAGLAAIAVTDHNTAAWCDDVTAAAADSNLVVLPGVEISTTEGHLLAIFEEGTSESVLNELLVDVGIGAAKRGDVHVVSKGGFIDTAKAVAAAGGIAVLAHIDQDKGLLKQPVPAQVRSCLTASEIAAFEIVDETKIAPVQRRAGRHRILAFVRGSDSMAPHEKGHRLDGIGQRRTWIKAARPDLCGLRHALYDPDLRVRLEPPAVPSDRYIRSITVSGGFLDGLSIDLSPDLNCLVGGTGTGKSLTIELIRFALDQQTDRSLFPSIRGEVDQKLLGALGDGSSVELVIADGDDCFTVRRAFHSSGSSAAEIVGSGVNDGDVSSVMPIRAFSQGEVIEFAREQVSRMSLLDSSLDLDDESRDEKVAIVRLKSNGRSLARVRADIAAGSEKVAKLPDLVARVEELSDLFDADVVQEQASWSKEKAHVDKLSTTLPPVEELTPMLSVTFAAAAAVPDNEALFSECKEAIAELRATVENAARTVKAAHERAQKRLDSVAAEWRERRASFDEQLNAELSKVDAGGKGLAALKSLLGKLQTEQAELEELQRSIEYEMKPRMSELLSKREDIVQQLVDARSSRRNRRALRIRELNRLMSGDVKMSIKGGVDDSEFRSALVDVAKGSYLSKETLEAISSGAAPTRLVRSFLANDAAGVSDATGVDEDRVQKLFEHVVARNLVEQFLEIQSVDVLDGLAVGFRKPESSGEYIPIEHLSHGQKCTAILIIALADGTMSLVIDQPEDALHAPWIEEQLVGRLRSLRGSRQFIFATRSPGLVISADAELIVTLASTATAGSVQASGSLERYDLNELALYHLEGGAEALRRRAEKLAPSIKRRVGAPTSRSS